MAAITKIDYRRLCIDLLKAESEEEITSLLRQHGLLDMKHWRVLGNMPNNRSIVNNQQQDATGAMVEKIVNSIDAMLIKESFLHGIAPDGDRAPDTMSHAAEQFFRIRDGNLANLTARELTRLAENIHVVATGAKSDPCYLVVDLGEGQTPARFSETFLSLVKANKARIPFVQGKFNVGGTGVLPFCGTQSYQLIISRRCPDIPSDPGVPGAKDSTHGLWGFTLIRKLPASARVFDTMTYIYLAPNGDVARFEAAEIPALPDIVQDDIGDEPDTEEESKEESNARPTPRAYQKGLTFGTVIKLYDYRWKARSLATRDVRFEFERYLYRIALPIRVAETRQGYRAHYFSTTVAGTAVTVTKDQEKRFLEPNFPVSGVIQPEGIGNLPISIVLYRERADDKRGTKDPKRLPKGLLFTINGQVHYPVGPEFFVTRGLNYGYIKDTLLVTVDCTQLPEDIRDQLIMPSRDRLRKLPEFETILDGIVADLKDRDVLRKINDERRLRRVQQALTQDAAQDVLQALVDRDPVFATLFAGGRGLRNPFRPGVQNPEPPYKGKLPPTYCHFENGEHEITKSFSVDRTCVVELETDAVNEYFDLADPLDRGELIVQPGCYERWHLSNGRLRVTFRAPSNARISDSLDVVITVIDPHRRAAGAAPWLNKVKLVFTEGGKVVTSGTKKRSRKEISSLEAPNVIEVFRDKWHEHDFNERSALHIVAAQNGGHDFYINMDNTYLHNELIQRKPPEKEAARFAYKWGLVLVALGILQELKRQERDGPERDKNKEKEDEIPADVPAEDQVGRFSQGVAAVIIPTVLNLMETLPAANGSGSGGIV